MIHLRDLNQEKKKTRLSQICMCDEKGISNKTPVLQFLKTEVNELMMFSEL